MADTSDHLTTVDTLPGPRFVLDTGRRCTICLAPLFGDPGSITINRKLALAANGDAVTVSFPVCTVCVDPIPPHRVRLDRWKIARPGPDMSIDVFDHRGQIHDLIRSGLDSYYSRSE